MSTQAGVDPTQAWPLAHEGLHALAVAVHCPVDTTQASVLAQNWARQGEVSTVAASSKAQPPAAGVALMLVATRTLEISAPFVPPGAMDWYTMTKAPSMNSIFA